MVLGAVREELASPAIRDTHEPPPYRNAGEELAAR
jgi:hypothetical protein